MWSLSFLFVFFFFKQKTAYEMRISDWSSDVCSSDLLRAERAHLRQGGAAEVRPEEAGVAPLRAGQIHVLEFETVKHAAPPGDAGAGRIGAVGDGLRDWTRSQQQAEPAGGSAADAHKQHTLTRTQHRQKIRTGRG